MRYCFRECLFFPLSVDGTFLHIIPEIVDFPISVCLCQHEYLWKGKFWRENERKHRIFNKRMIVIDFCIVRAWTSHVSFTPSFRAERKIISSFTFVTSTCLLPSFFCQRAYRKCVEQRKGHEIVIYAFLLHKYPPVELKYAMFFLDSFR